MDAENCFGLMKYSQKRKTYMYIEVTKEINLFRRQIYSMEL